MRKETRPRDGLWRLVRRAFLPAPSGAMKDGQR